MNEKINSSVKTDCRQVVQRTVQGYRVKLTFAEQYNTAVPNLVRKTLMNSYANQGSSSADN